MTEPAFGSTCTCGQYTAPGVTHNVGEPCTVDETGEEYTAVEIPPYEEVDLSAPEE